MSINQRQRKFVEAYAKTGNAAQAYVDAGYAVKSVSAAAVNANRLLKNANIAAALDDLNKKTEKSTICTLEEIREFHSRTLRDAGEEMQFRQKAADLLTKMGGGYLEKQEVTHRGGVTVYSPKKREDN